jgi:hypothetical protein
VDASLLAIRQAILGAVGASVLGGCVGAGDSSSATSSTSSGISLRCVDPQAVTNPDGSLTPFVKCADGSVDRPGGGVCDPTINNTPTCPLPTPLCSVDGDCTTGPNGHCIYWAGGDNKGCECTYGCTTDADCGPESACVCAGASDAIAYSRCVHATECRVDADCASGECGLSWGPEIRSDNKCPVFPELRCRSAQDACRSNVDCPGDEAPFCVHVPNDELNRRTCWGPGLCLIGRPLVVEGAWRVACGMTRSDWSQGSTPLTAELENLSPTVRERAAAHYLAIAKLEHASVASFMRFALALLAHGAPADLVRDANAAALDEIEHARAAFALASALAGEPLGPAAESKSIGSGARARGGGLRRRDRRRRRAPPNLRARHGSCPRRMPPADRR